MALLVEQFICREDNFAVILHDEATGKTLAVDAPDGEAILQVLQQRGWGLDLLLITHHHGDHTAGIGAIKRATGAKIIGPKREATKIDGLETQVDAPDRIDFAGQAIEVIATPGHTAGAVSYYLPQAGLAFTGDTLFSLGIGRLFECSADIMLQSLKRLAALPPQTQIYCGHEYTKSNGRFALSVDGDNEALKARLKQVDQLLDSGRATLPTILSDELRTNPFLRYDNRKIIENLGLAGKDEVTILAELRRRKDVF